MVVHKCETTRDHLRLLHGTQGQTVQTVEAERRGQGLRLTVRRVGSTAVTVDLDSTGVEALRAWLAPVPGDSEEQG